MSVWRVNFNGHSELSGASSQGGERLSFERTHAAGDGYRERGLSLREPAAGCSRWLKLSRRTRPYTFVATNLSVASMVWYKNTSLGVGPQGSITLSR